MRDYQRQKNNRYILPNAVYHQTIWVIRDYDRMCSELHDILVESPDPPDGMPRGSNTGDETYTKAKRREELRDKVSAIEDALELIPEEYRKGIWRNIQENRPFPSARSTYGYWKTIFVYEIAKKIQIF